MGWQDTARLAAKVALASALGFAALAQLVPFGRSHDSPPVVAEPAWDSPASRDLATRACFDCHSNRTRWPWYAHVAPVSWLVMRDVKAGRQALNFSEWTPNGDEAAEAAEQLESGDMPPWIYTAVHPEARLSPDERRLLVRGLRALVRRQPATGDDGPPDSDD